MKELFYAYQQTKLKKTTPQVREGILKGEWRNIDLDQAVSMN
jgi:hypothetical protein